jgi:DNA ligase-1
MMHSIKKGGDLGTDERVTAVLWDQIPLHEAKPKGSYKAPYRERYAALIAQVSSAEAGPLSVIETRIVYSLAEAYAHYREILVKGGEGTVAKHPDAIWRDGDSLEQVKLKLAADCDLVIVGFRPGEGKNAALFGSVLGRTADNLLEVAVSGMSDKVRKEVAANRDRYLGTIMTVRSNSIMAPTALNQLHSLFSPRVVEFRGDKSEADTLERVRGQFEAAIFAA